MGRKLNPRNPTNFWRHSSIALAHFIAEDYAEMLEEDAEDVSKEEIADMAARIKQSANLMFALVSNLLDVNRIEQGKMDLELGPCDLWDTARQAVEGR